MPLKRKEVAFQSPLLLKAVYQGADLLKEPYFNKGSAFPADERDIFKLHGRLPANIDTLEEQVTRAYQQYSSRADDLAKNTFLSSLKIQNEVLYYRVCYGPVHESNYIKMSR